MWRVTWQTGVAYLIFGTVYLGAYQTLVSPDWNALSVAALAATGMLGWALVICGTCFLVFSVCRRLVKRATHGDA